MLRSNIYLGLLSVGLLFISSVGCWQGAPSASDTPQSNYSTTSVNSSSPRPDLHQNENKKMDEKEKQSGFAANMPEGFVQPTDAVGNKLLREYGAIFVARGGAIPPKKIVFKDESDVSSFQAGLQRSTENIGGFAMELQSAAMDDLRKALADAKAQGLSITPRAADSAKRTYNETVSLWNSRVEPGLKHWVGQGKLTKDQADRIRSMSPFEQVSEILKLEEQGMFFAKDLSKSIIYSVAPPGTSQHLSMLAFDVTEHDNAKVRELLAKYNWYQTVVSDLPHFTYLGVPENELTALGLKRAGTGGRTFWTPDI